MPLLQCLAIILVFLGGASSVCAQEQPAAPPKERPRLLIPLYVAVAATEGMDAHSTLLGISRGAREGNRMMRPLVIDRPAAYVGLKVAATAGWIVIGEQLWKRDHRVLSMLTMAAATAWYLDAVIPNYRLNARLK